MSGSCTFDIGHRVQSGLAPMDGEGGEPSKGRARRRIGWMPAKLEAALVSFNPVTDTQLSKASHGTACKEMRGAPTAPIENQA